MDVVALFCDLLKMKKWTYHMSLFLCLFSLGQYCWKRSCQKWGVWKKDKKGDGHIGGCI